MARFSETWYLVKKCVLIFSATFVWNISHSKSNRARYNQKRISVFMQLLLSNYNNIWILSTDLRKILRHHISWKFVLWEPNCSVRTDGRTEMTKLTVALSILQMLLQRVLYMRKGRQETDCAWVSGTRWHRKKHWIFTPKRRQHSPYPHNIITKITINISLKKCNSLNRQKEHHHWDHQQQYRDHQNLCHEHDSFKN